MSEAKKKISQLPIAQSLKGLWTIGVDALNKSVRISMDNILDTKQDKLSAGVGIEINGKTISCTGSGGTSGSQYIDGGEIDSVYGGNDTYDCGEI